MLWKSPSRPSQRAMIVVAVSAALFPSLGCGLSSYEDLLAAEQKRVAALDEQNKALGDPADYPLAVRPGSDAQADTTADIFIRLPHGIATKSDHTMNDIVRRYPRGMVDRYASRSAKRKESPFLEVYLAVEAGAKPEPFRAKVLQGFPPATEKMVKTTEESAGLGRTELLSAMLADANAAYWTFFASIQSVQVAVIFQVPKDKAQAPEVKKGIDLSLQSMVIGPEAAQWRQRFTSEKEPKKKRG